MSLFHSKLTANILKKQASKRITQNTAVKRKEDGQANVKNLIPSKTMNRNDVIKIGRYVKHPPLVIYLPSVSLI